MCFLLVSLNIINSKYKAQKLVNKDFFSFVRMVFLFKYFWNKHKKLNIYALVATPKYALSSAKRNLVFILKKKKQGYFFSIMKHNELVLTISLGAILKYFKIELKSVKKTKKGFTMFLSTFKKIFNKYNNITAYRKTVFINFFDFYLMVFFNKFNFIFKKNTQVLLNLNQKTNLKAFKKVKGIKRRVIKKKTQIFLQDWKVLNNKKMLITGPKHSIT